MSSQKQGLLPINQHAMKFLGHLSYHEYEGIAFDLEEQRRLLDDMGPHNRAMILRNHGLLVGGRTIAEAFDHIYFLERACEAQLATQAAGMDQIQIPTPAAQQKAEGQYAHDEIPMWVDIAWEAALRLIDPEHSDVWT